MLREAVTLRWTRADHCGGCGAGAASEVRGFRAVPLLACDECGLLRLRDRVAEEDLALLYAGAYAPGTADPGGALANPTFEYRRRRLERFTGGASRMFEIGCGDGNFLASLQRAGWEVGGCEVDASAPGVVQARHGIAIMQGDVMAAAGRGVGAPVIAAYHVLEHVYQPRAWLQAVHAMLESDGLLHLQVPNFASITRRVSGSDWASTVHPQHVHFFTPSTLQALLGRAGFEVLSSSTWDPWHGPGTVAISLAGRLRRMQRGPIADPTRVIASGAQPAAAAGGPRGPAVRAARALFGHVSAVAARAEAAIGCGAVVDMIARRLPHAGR